MHNCQREMHLPYASGRAIIASMQKERTKDVLARLIEASGKRPTEVARESGVAQSTLSRILQGKIESPTDRQVQKLAEYFGVTTDQLRGRQPVELADLFSLRTHDLPKSKDVAPAPQAIGLCPEISWVQAGAWTEVCHVERDPEAITWHPRPAGASEQTFVLRVVGESMAPEYLPGTLIYVDPERAPENGKDVVAVMTETGEATFKRLIEEPGHGRMLKALNPAWHEPYIKINGNCRVVGVVVADMRLR
ncbi:XRE family transcriptional regulator [Halomonas salipaludis]|nr:XRE family transcriptional regulator [Halomonas salipaludis]